MSHKQELKGVPYAGFGGFLALLVAVCLVGSGLALQCRVCHSAANYQECLRSASVPCTESLVNTTHLFLTASNPTLRNVTFQPAPQFQCFQVNYTVAGIWSYQMGCTYATTKICEGWRTAAKCRTETGNMIGVPTRRKAPQVADYAPQAPPLVIVPHDTYIVLQDTPPPAKSPAIVVVARNYKSSSGSVLMTDAMTIKSLLLTIVGSWMLKKLSTY